VEPSFSVTSVKVVSSNVYIALIKGSSCMVSRLRGDSIEPLTSLNSSSCLILEVSSEGLLVSSGDSLYLVSEGETKLLLKASRTGNRFWHACKGDGRLYVQEYGMPPTGIYVSEDMKNFRRIVTNMDLDPWSKHFHYVAFDKRRNALVATLGDGNLTRVAMSLDYGRSWRAVYRGPWQFVPVLIEEDKWLFGFDSGIAKGGVAIYYPDSGKWEFMFLRLKGYPRAQFAELKKLRDLYVGALGYPSAVIVSRSVNAWHMLYRSNVSDQYEYHVSVDALGDIAYAVVEDRLMMFDRDQIQQALTEIPVLVRYGAYTDRLRGFIFMLKRLKQVIHQDKPHRD
jgi:hypothetical protein